MMMSEHLRVTEVPRVCTHEERSHCIKKYHMKKGHIRMKKGHMKKGHIRMKKDHM